MTTRWKLVNRPGSQKGPSATPHLSGVGFSEGGHHVCKDRARLGEEGLPAPQIGCPCGTTLVSVVSVLKKCTRKSPQRPLPLHFGFPGPSLSWNLRYRIGDWPGYIVIIMACCGWVVMKMPGEHSRVLLFWMVGEARILRKCHPRSPGLRVCF